MNNGSINDSKNNSNIVIYESDGGKLKIDVKLESETAWLTQQQLAELFQASKQLVSYHINNIFEEGELDKNSVVKKYLTTANDGKN